MGLGFVARVVLCGVLLLAAAGCSGEPEAPESANASNASGGFPTSSQVQGQTPDLTQDRPARGPSQGPRHKVCLALSSDGLGDKGYNDMQYAALAAGRARHGYALDMQAMPPVSSHANSNLSAEAWAKASASTLGTLIQRNCTVVIAGQGWSMLSAVQGLAPQHPQVTFFVVDAAPAVYAPNVAGSRFHVEEAAFLAGYLSASMSRTHVLASIGGAAAPAVLDFIQGFEAGAIHHDPHCILQRIFLAEAAPKSNPWSSPGKAQEVALSLAREHQADVLFAVAGGSNPGVFRATAEEGLHAVGVDTDQDYLAKGVILTSVMKRLDVALEQVIDAIMYGEFKNRLYAFSLANGGVSLSPMTYTRAAIPPALLTEMEQLRAGIIAGDILVPSSQ
ncbi:BMP family lipoprotein [Megalodesulfovibrio paquesii]